jgi:predicted ABC-type ATPase
MFAGPNGSGKSTIKSDLRPVWLGAYVNADEIEASLRSTDGFDLSTYPRSWDEDELRDFLARSPLAARSGSSTSMSVENRNDRLRILGTPIDSYLAATVAEFLRQKLLAERASFTFETVMSHRSKVDILKAARLQGYRTYLYFIATETPRINIDRVRLRVSSGGHDVPEDKIVERYERSLQLLPEAIYRSDRAFLFDNSGDLDQRVCFAEFEGGTRLTLRTSNVPRWFKRSVLDKLVTG